MRISVTGANGLVGKALQKKIALNHDFKGHYIVRTAQNPDDIIGPNLAGSTAKDWLDLLNSTDVVVHLAAALPWTSDGHETLGQVNVDGTRSLAEAAAQAGVKRLVFISTLGVHGVTSGETPFTPESPIKPSGDYAQTKYEAEEMLRELCANEDMELVILRPPVVYGPGVGGKIGLLANKIAKDARLPLGRILGNRRQMVSADNLANAILLACSHSRAPNSVLLPADTESVSTFDFLEMLALSLGRPLRLAPIPEIVFRLARPLPVVGGIAERLIGNVEVSDPHLHGTLGWTAPHSLQDGIDAMCKELGK